jgi:hypothetical protein
MKLGNTSEWWGRFNYREIVPRERIVWLNSFANQDCGIARAPFSDRCPLEIENTAIFVEKDGVTRVTMRSKPFGASPEEVKFFDELCSSGSLEQGTSGTLDQLGAHLKQGMNPD